MARVALPSRQTKKNVLYGDSNDAFFKSGSNGVITYQQNNFHNANVTKVTTVGGGLDTNVRSYIINSIAPQNGIFGIWLKFEDYSTLGGVTIRFTYNDFLSNVVQTLNISPLASSGIDAPEWKFFTLQPDDWTTAGVFIAGSSCNQMQLTFNSAGGASYALIYSAFGDIRQRSRHLITFDDSYITDYTIAHPYLVARNLKASFYTIKDTVTSTGVTIANLQTMYAYGHDIASHHQTDLTTFTLQQQIDTLKTIRDFLESNGMPRAARHLSLPGGFFNANTLTAMRTTGFLTARTTRDYLQQESVYLNKFSMVGKAGTAAPATAVSMLDYVDKGIKYGATTISYTHQLVAVTSGSWWAQAEWQAYIDGLVVRRNAGLLDIVTLSELYNDLTQSSRRQA